jgi:hypothetical protein
MQKRSLFSVLAVMVITVVLFSCKKDGNKPPAGDTGYLVSPLTGTWKISYVATDADSNMVLDGMDPVVYWDETVSIEYLNFSVNDTGFKEVITMMPYKDDTTMFHWTTYQDRNVVKITAKEGNREYPAYEYSPVTGLTLSYIGSDYLKHWKVYVKQ